MSSVPVKRGHQEMSASSSSCPCKGAHYHPPVIGDSETCLICQEKIDPQSQMSFVFRHEGCNFALHYKCSCRWTMSKGLDCRKVASCIICKKTFRVDYKNVHLVHPVEIINKRICRRVPRNNSPIDILSQRVDSITYRFEQLVMNSFRGGLPHVFLSMSFFSLDPS